MSVLRALLMITLSAAPAAFAQAPRTPNVARTPHRAPADRLPDGRQRLVWLDFGPTRSPVAPGAFAVARAARSKNMVWTRGMLLEKGRRRPTDFLLHDYLEGLDATFVMGIRAPRGSFRFVLTLGNPDRAQGPVNVTANGVGVARAVTTKAGEAVDVAFDVAPEEGRLAIRLESPGCVPFAVAGAALYGPQEAEVVDLYPPPGRFAIPSPDSLPALSPAQVRDLLGRFCEFLIREQPVDGGFSFHGAWYQSAYPVRTLLAGGALLGKPEWTEAALRCLDQFVAAQKSDGRWSALYFGRKECQTEAGLDTSTANLADVGSMAHCLGLAIPRAAGERRQRYLAALKAYADKVVLPAQLPSGAFPNLRYRGVVYRHPYSVATAVQASMLAVLHAATRDPRYLRAAERAALWLCDGFRPDGQVTFHPHNSETPVVMAPNRFGDLFYVVESLVWVQRYTDREEVRSGIGKALEAYLWGFRGLHKSAVHGYWWPREDLWTSAKMGGMVFVLSQYARTGRKASEARTWAARALGWLSNPDFSRHIGVLAESYRPEGDFGLPATGFAGIGVASVIDVSILAP